MAYGGMVHSGGGRHEGRSVRQLVCIAFTVQNMDRKWDWDTTSKPTTVASPTQKGSAF